MSINKIGLLKAKNAYIVPQYITAIVDNKEDYPSIRLIDGRSYKLEQDFVTIDDIAQKMQKAIISGETIDLDV